MAKQTKPWINYGDINFIEHGGFLVRETDYPECYDVIYLETNIYDYNGDYKIPMIVVKCFVDLSDWLKPDDKERIKFNQECGFDDDYIPTSLEEKMCYCADLVDKWGSGVWEFDPVFPKETGLGCYSCPDPMSKKQIMEQMIVGKTIAQRFLKEYGVPLRYRRTTMLERRGA